MSRGEGALRKRGSARAASAGVVGLKPGLCHSLLPGLRAHVRALLGRSAREDGLRTSGRGPKGY